VKLSRFSTRNGQLTIAQVASLAVSGLFFISGNMVLAMAFLTLATLFGVTSAIRKYRDARKEYPEMFQQRQRKRRR
jgi:hypothetical protein